MKNSLSTVSLIFAMGCATSLSIGLRSYGAELEPKAIPPAPIVLPPEVEKEVRNALACAKKPSTECSVKLGDSGTPFGLMQRGYALMSKMESTPADLAQARLDFRAAAKLDYPPAFEALAILLERTDLDLSIAFRAKAATLGHGEAASSLLSKPEGQRPGVERIAPIDKAFFSQVACHPAAFYGENRLMYALSNALDEAPLKNFKEVLRQTREASAQKYADQAAHYLSACAKATYYIEQIREPTGGAASEQIRARMLATLENIRVAAEKFPELQIFSRQEYQSLLPPK
jgi:hypothetical protein